MSHTVAQPSLPLTATRATGQLSVRRYLTVQARRLDLVLNLRGNPSALPPLHALQSIPGWAPVKRSVVKVRQTNSATFFSKGKLQEVTEMIEDARKIQDIDTVFVNELILSPRQQDRLQTLWNAAVVDRFSV